MTEIDELEGRSAWVRQARMSVARRPGTADFVGSMQPLAYRDTRFTRNTSARGRPRCGPVRTTAGPLRDDSQPVSLRKKVC